MPTIVDRLLIFWHDSCTIPPPSKGKKTLVIKKDLDITEIPDAPGGFEPFYDFGQIPWDAGGGIADVTVPVGTGGAAQVLDVGQGTSVPWMGSPIPEPPISPQDVIGPTTLPSQGWGLPTFENLPVFRPDETGVSIVVTLPPPPAPPAPVLVAPPVPPCPICQW